MKKKDLIKILDINAYLVWTLSIGTFFDSKAVYERISKPQIGDLVFELTTSFRPSEDRIGRLLSIKKGSNEFERTWKIKTLNGRIKNWSNCKFITILEDRFNFKLY